MKIGFYSPYLESLSGGERYTLTLASHWSKTHDVSLFTNDLGLQKKAKERFGIDLSRVQLVPNIFKTRNIFKKLLISRTYDLLFFLTDGSIPTTFARYNILHFQVPFTHLRLHSIKMSRFNAIVCNSDFTKRNLDARIAKKSTVIYPPVMSLKQSGFKKQKMILSVGRFHQLKKQDVLIEAFRESGIKEAELVLTGGLLPEDKPYFSRLQLSAKKLNVRLLPNVSFKELVKLYNQSSVYWHAAGYHEVKPEHMEHFGITLVEAMSTGSIPVAFAGGGIPEIVQDGESGFLWGNTKDLIQKTKNILLEGKSVSTLRRNAMSRAKFFSVKQFSQDFDVLLASLTS